MNRKISNFAIFSAYQFEKIFTKVGCYLLCSLVIGHDVYLSGQFLL